jgi:TonB family protein
MASLPGLNISKAELWRDYELNESEVTRFMSAGRAAVSLSFSLIFLLCHAVHTDCQTGLVGQSQVISVSLAQDQIVAVKTARGITTRLVFSERVQDIVCGDLYDPTTGVGTFVIQRVGNDIFLKPIVAEGLSNLFVKVGEQSEITYAFDLFVGPAQQAFRVVRVTAKSVSPEVKEVKEVKASVRAMIRPPAGRQINYAVDSDPDAPPGIVTILPLALELSPPPNPDRSGDVGTAEVLTGTRGLSPRRAIRTHKPDYPDSALRAGIVGEVVIEVQIDQKGDVVSAKVLSGNSLLKFAALGAALRWKFEPVAQAVGSESGSTITESKIIKFNFVFPAIGAQAQKTSDRD